MQPEVLLTISQSERFSQALHVGQTLYIRLCSRSIEFTC